MKDVDGRLATVDGCPAETVLRDLVCALPVPFPAGPVDCTGLDSLVQVTPANETALTNSLFRGKCNNYERSFYDSTLVYRRFVVDVVWNEELVSF